MSVTKQDLHREQAAHEATRKHLDDERKAHAETRANLDAAKALADQSEIALKSERKARAKAAKAKPEIHRVQVARKDDAVRIAELTAEVSRLERELRAAK